MKRSLIKTALVLGAILIALAAPSPSFGAPVRLAADGKTDYVIVTPENPSVVQKTAAAELAANLKEITGAEFSIETESAAALDSSRKQFVIGPSKTSAALLMRNGGKSDADSGYDTVRIERCGESIVLSGHPVRGPLYAVNTFLENDLGCRWWTAAESFIPKNAKPKIEITPVDYTPKLQSRESFYTGFNGPENARFAVRMKCNGNSNTIPDELGGHQAFQFFVHSFYPLIPPEKYFHDHPDWFPEIDGVRKVGRPGWCKPGSDYEKFAKTLQPEQIHEAGTQLCLTSEGLFQEMLKNALEALKSNPKATILSISQNDWHGFCTCAKCKAINDEEGSHAGTLLRFVNRLAEEIEKVYPNVYVDTLAYQYTRKPPKITHARHNVIVRLCSIECSFVQPLATGEQNASFKADMEGWSKMAPNIFIWDYMTDFALYLLPFPNYRVWKDNINFFVDHNTIGLFEQGDYHLPTGDFVQLRGWTVAKLLWNPSLDQGRLMDEFIAGYYAPELVPIYREYFDTLSDACEKSGIHLGIFKRSSDDWLDLDSLNKATALQNRAVETAEKLAAENPEKYAALPDKVWRERIPLDLVWLMNWRPFKMESRLGGKEFLGPADPLAAAKELFVRFEKNGLVQHAEWATADDFAAFKQSIIDRFDPETSSATLPEFLRDLPESKWYDVQETELNTGKVGEWTFVERDEAASNKKAIRMPGTHHEWAVSGSVTRLFQLFHSLLGENAPIPKVHAYVWVRADSDSADGGAMTMGIYDDAGKKGVISKTIPLAEIAGPDYKKIDLGVFEPLEGEYFWAAPVQRDDLKNVWIDRVILVWE